MDGLLIMGGRMNEWTYVHAYARDVRTRVRMCSMYVCMYVGRYVCTHVRMCIRKYVCANANFQPDSFGRQTHRNLGMNASLPLAGTFYVVTYVHYAKADGERKRGAHGRTDIVP